MFEFGAGDAGGDGCPRVRKTAFFDGSAAAAAAAAAAIAGGSDRLCGRGSAGGT